MAKRMLIDAAHPEETRVVVLSGNRLEEFDFETSTKKQIKGNIYLAKITRVEPSLQAAFVDFGGNRHGFLAFSEIHPDYYRIPVDDRSSEERWHEERPAAHEALPAPEAAPVIDHPVMVVEQEAAPDAEQPAAPEEKPAPERRRRRPRTKAAPAEEVTAEAAPPAEAAAEPSAAEALASKSTPIEAAIPDESATAAPEAASEGEGEVPAKPKRARRPRTPRAKAEAAGDDVVYAEASPEDLRGGEDGHESDHPAGDAADEALETLGGDEIEEVQRHRTRSLRSYKIQEVIKRRQVLLVQVTKEERGNKGAALTTYLSLAGRYCVLMPNTGRGGGVSRKITNGTDRRRLKDMLEDLEIPEGMGVIVRTAGSERSKTEIKRDYEYLLRLWDEIRELTLRSSAPSMIYEEGNLIKRSIRDLYTRDIDEVLVEGEEGYRTAKDFMKMLMPSHAKRVQPYRDVTVPLFHRFQVENQIDAIHSPVVQLRSGGYIVINPTEALVAIDVNSGRSTKERNIEETALRTNLEAADEIARQLRLRDLAGLIVIDFIDMEETRNQAAVERRVKDAMRNDRARIQIGRISPFGLLELSRQRLRPSLVEASTQPCPHCAGTGHIRSTESTALHVLRALEEEGLRHRSSEVCVYVPTTVALYILNHKHAALSQVEARCGFRVIVANDDELIPPAFRLERVRSLSEEEIAVLPPVKALAAPPLPEIEELEEAEDEEEPEERGKSSGQRDAASRDAASREGDDDEQGRRRRRRRRRRRGGEEAGNHHGAEAAAEAEEEMEPAAATEAVAEADDSEAAEAVAETANDEEGPGRKRRRRGRRGGRRRGKGEAGSEETSEEFADEDHAAEEEVAEAAAAPAAVEPAGEAFLPVTEAPMEIPADATSGVAETKQPEPAPTPMAEHSQVTVVSSENGASRPTKRGWWRR